MNDLLDHQELEDLKRRVTRLEQELLAPLVARAEASEAKQRIEGRRIWENLPLTALIVLLAWKAASWVHGSLWG